MFTRGSTQRAHTHTPPAKYTLEHALDNMSYKRRIPKRYLLPPVLRDTKAGSCPTRTQQSERGVDNRIVWLGDRRDAR